MIARAPLVFILLVSVLAAAGAAQVLYTLVSPNEETYGLFGHSVSCAGDVNGDGYDDVVVGAHYEECSDGRAYVFDGQTGDRLYTLVSPNIGGRFGRSVSGAGDVNGNGYDDVMVGALYENPGSSPDNAGRAYVFDGQTGSLLYTLVSPNEQTNGVFGFSVSGVGDVNGDGYDDVMVGALYENPGSSPDNAGRAYMFDGQTGDLLYTLVSPNEETDGQFGCSVSGAGDVNGDGYDDVVVGALLEDPGSSPYNAGRTYVFDGQTGTLLYTLVSPNEQQFGYFGKSVSGAGDINGDGYDDVVVGAYGDSPGSSPDYAGRAYVFDGHMGILLHSLVSPNEEYYGWFGCSVSGAGDVDGDGYDDVVVGADGDSPGSSPDYAGRAYVFSGFLIPVELTGFTASVENGTVVLTWATLSEHENFGFHVYRSHESTGEYMRITEAIIPGAGNSSVRHDYSYSDKNAPTGTTCFYKLADIDFQGHETLHGPVSVRVLPSEFTLLGASPNPFDETTTLRLNLSAKSHVCLRIYNLAGELVRTLANEEMEAGVFEIMWDGKDDAGRYIPPGVYTYRAQSDGVNRSGKLILIRG